MLIGQRLRELRESKKLSQGEIEKRTGLLRCYTSRVECGHTVPNIETLEKYARALEVPLYRLFYEGDAAPQKPNLPASKKTVEWGITTKQSSEFHALVRLLARMKERDRILLLGMAQQMTRPHRRKQPERRRHG
jgi:transcriptional regulator with XRE-family HTH domain